MNKIITICKNAIKYNDIYQQKLYFIDLINYNYDTKYRNYKGVWNKMLAVIGAFFIFLPFIIIFYAILKAIIEYN